MRHKPRQVELELPVKRAYIENGQVTPGLAASGSSGCAYATC
jgi:hypothetical protein